MRRLAWAISSQGKRYVDSGQDISIGIIFEFLADSVVAFKWQIFCPHTINQCSSNASSLLVWTEMSYTPIKQEDIDLETNSSKSPSIASSNLVGLHLGRSGLQRAVRLIGLFFGVLLPWAATIYLMGRLHQTTSQNPTGHTISGATELPQILYCMLFPSFVDHSTSLTNHFSSRATCPRVRIPEVRPRLRMGYK